MRLGAGDGGRLVSFSGRSGVGKSTLAERLAAAIGAVWLRIDSIEQAIRGADGLCGEVGVAGYLAAHAVASDNLRLGRTVIADCVNDYHLARDAWRDVGRAAGARVFEIEVRCSDPDAHRRRVETRGMTVPGLTGPSWRETMDRVYQPWTRHHLLVDTSLLSIDASLDRICDYLGPA